jgi:hypothetical protein
MYFPPVMVVVAAGEAKDLKVMLEETFGEFKVTNIQPAAENKAAVFVEFGDVQQTAEMEAMRETLRTTGQLEGRFRMVAQMF